MIESSRIEVYTENQIALGIAWWRQEKYTLEVLIIIPFFNIKIGIGKQIAPF